MAFLKMSLLVLGIFGAVAAFLNFQESRSRETAAAQTPAIKAAVPASQRAARDKAQLDAELKKIKEEGRFRIAVGIARAVKQNLKNPDSFQLVDMIGMADGTLCMSYRGTNSFNAVITEHVGYSPEGKSRAWNKYCANKRGDDLSDVQKAL